MAKKKRDRLDELVDELLKNQSPEEALSDSGALKELKKRLVEKALEGELTEHLGYEKHSTSGRRTGNSRNGKTPKRVIDGEGEMEIEVPRDRQGEFEPQLVCQVSPSCPHLISPDRSSLDCLAEPVRPFLGLRFTVSSLRT